VNYVLQNSIMPHWNDLDMQDVTCGPAYPGGCGVYTSVVGIAPNRIYDIEWRAVYSGTTDLVNFEVRLYEGQSRFDVIYGIVSHGGVDTTVGVRGLTTADYTLQCASEIVENQMLIYTQPQCPSTETPTASSTNTLTPTRTTTSTPTQTPVGPTDTATILLTNTSTNTPVTSTSTACPIQFIDVPQGSTFYPYIRCLACRGIVNGYADGTFKPNNNVTRGQLSKIVSNAAGFSDPQPTQLFQDVPVNSTFQVYMGRLATRGYISGYACGGTDEPCVPPANLPYFRPNNNATRGQISKIDSNAAGFSDSPVGQQFEDVPHGSTYYTYTYRLISRSIMSGYQCGSAGEPCIPPNDLPYFRPNNNATRGQTSKIVANTFFSNCQTPERR
jgi:hypothetical protein